MHLVVCQHGMVTHPHLRTFQGDRFFVRPISVRPVDSTTELPGVVDVTNTNYCKERQKCRSRQETNELDVVKVWCVPIKLVFVKIELGCLLVCRCLCDVGPSQERPAHSRWNVVHPGSNDRGGRTGKFLHFLPVRRGVCPRGVCPPSCRHQASLSLAVE